MFLNDYMNTNDAAEHRIPVKNRFLMPNHTYLELLMNYEELKREENNAHRFLYWFTLFRATSSWLLQSQQNLPLFSKIYKESSYTFTKNSNAHQPPLLNHHKSEQDSTCWPSHALGTPQN